MIIALKKRKHKPSTLSCTRTDGSVSWTKLQRGVETHDLAHFAVETTLGFTGAFYGIIARGFDISDFELPREQRPQTLIPANLPEQAIQTEHIVNLLQIEFFNSGEDPDFISTLRSALAAKNIRFPENLDQYELENIRSRFGELLMQWRSLGEGETMELEFNIKK